MALTEGQTLNQHTEFSYGTLLTTYTRSRVVPPVTDTYLTVGFLTHKLGECQFLHGGISQDRWVRGFSAAVYHGRPQNVQKPAEHVQKDT